MSARIALWLAALAASFALAPVAVAHGDGDGHDEAAAQGAAPADAGTAAAPAPDPDPISRLDLVNAKIRLDRADAAYSLMLSRNFPRGDARAEILKERDDARADWERLRAAKPDIAKQLEGNGGG